MTDDSSVALALGGGGARGYAHIGVLAELEARGYRVTRVAGTSMGALVGALYCAGRLEEFTDWVTSFRTQVDVLRFLGPNFSGPSTIRIARVLDRVGEIIGVERIEELPIRFTAVATDLWARKEIWFEHGPIGPAIHASIAVPGVFPPVVLNGRLLVDGGVLNQVPVSVLAGAGAQLTVAVSLDGPPEDGHGGQTPVQTSSDEQPDEQWIARLARSMGQLFDTDAVRTFVARLHTRPKQAALEAAEAARDVVEEMPIGLRTTDVMQMALETMQAVMERFQFAAFPTDVTVVVPRDSLGMMDFHRAADQIELGRRRAAEAFDEAGLGTRPETTS